MPRWLGVAGLVVTVLVLASALVAPLTVLGLWLVVSGIVLARTPSREVAHAAQK